MAEKVLALPLSGLEIRKAILDKVSLALSRDCYLNDDTAYDYFEADVRISLRATDVGREVKVNVQENAGAGTPAPGTEAETSELKIESNSPNQTRVETGQPVPVLAKDEQGRDTVKHIKYSRKTVGAKAE